MKLVVCALFLVACTSNGALNPSGKVAVNTRALTFAGVSDADYGLAIFNGQDELVWRKDHLRASTYGSGASLAYVAPCDADQPQNRVELTINTLYDGTTPLGAETWTNPTAGGPITRTFTCRADADVAVDFDVTVMRAANQGFFDFAVELDGIFCSAKVDCVDALLLDPESSARGPTVVVGFACTSGDARPTWLHYSDVALVCGDHTTYLSPAAGPGNIGAPAPTLYGAATYRGQDDFGGQAGCHWNLALGLDEGAGAASCVLRASATATTAPLTGHTIAADVVYPFVTIEVPLTNASGEMTCGSHPLDGSPVGVATTYTSATPSPSFPYAWSCSDPEVTSERQLCGASTNQPVAITTTPSGVSFGVGASTSPSYTLEAGLRVRGCCANPCPACGP